MKNSRFYVLIILAVILLIGLISLNNGKIGITKLTAYSGVCDPPYTQYVVNAMDDTITACTEAPPNGPHGDDSAWQTVGVLAPPPVIGPMDLVNPDHGSPTAGTFGSNFLKVNWFTDSALCPQYIYLPQNLFEDQGCTVGNPRNWDATCYDYVGFNVYMNPNLNFSPVNPAPQSVSFFDGTITITASPVNCTISDGVANTYNASAPFAWVQHVTVSLKWLGNQYDVAKGHQFDLTNIQRVVINSPDVDYSKFTGSTYTYLGVDYIHWFPVYYDALILGSGLTAYGSPSYASPATITTVNQSSPSIHGAYISWNPFPIGSAQTGLTPTAYEVYRSINMNNPNGPYVLVNAPTVLYDQFKVQGVTDTACPGGGNYCYKVLTTNNGPSPNGTVEITNTVNASYHEARLQDVSAFCGWVDAIPTATVTVTAGTPGPTATPTPVNDINSAHVYPNPFNPNKGSKTFYVGNVAKGTTVQIYSMDGALVMKGSLSPGDAHYHPEFYPARFEWDGKNKNGSRVVSGLYYLVLQSPDKKTKTFRVIICYKCDPVYNKL
jgi:hypothetical protein